MQIEPLRYQGSNIFTGKQVFDQNIALKTEHSVGLVRRLIDNNKHLTLAISKAGPTGSLRNTGVPGITIQQINSNIAQLANPAIKE